MWKIIFILQLLTKETTAHPSSPAVAHLACVWRGDVNWGNEESLMPLLPVCFGGGMGRVRVKGGWEELV